MQSASLTTDRSTEAGIESLSAPVGAAGTVRLEGVSKTYAGATSVALHPIDLGIRAGEFFSILGPSGSGKTTTLRLIAGFERPDTGAVVLGGEDVTARPPNKRDVNTVFQNYALFPHLTVAANIAYPLRMKGIAGGEVRRLVAEALELVEMVGFETRLPHQLSGGQRQRIALARALVGRPKVLLLDEPLGALDLRLRQQMQHVLTSLQARLGLTFVYVTHDQGEALSMSDRVAVMNHGRVEQIGTPEDLYYSPRNDFVAGFVGKSNLLDVQVRTSGERFESAVAGRAFALPQATCEGRAKLVVRCENVALSAEPAADDALCLPGTVRDVLFLGTALEVSLDCGGTDLVALVPARRERALAAGDTVWCCVQAKDMVVLHDQHTV